MAQYSRPDADMVDGSFTPSAGSDLYACLDDNSDTDYISSQSAADDSCQVSAGTVTDPVSSSGHVLRARMRRSKAVSSYNASVVLKQGSTTIATLSVSGVDSSVTTYTYNLTSGEADSITDYSNLNFTITADYVSGSGCNLLVAWVELETPDAGATTYYSTPAGGVSPAGALATAKMWAVSLAGVLWLGAAGAVQKGVDGVLSFVGSLTKGLQRGLAGAVGPGGGLVKRGGRLLAGVLGNAGSLVRGIWRGLAGTVGPGGGLGVVKSILQQLAGAVGPGGALARSISRRLAAGLGSQAGLVRGITRAVAGVVIPSGLVVRSARMALTGMLTSTSALTRFIGRVLAGVLDWLGQAVGLLPVTPVVRSWTLQARDVDWSVVSRSRAWTLRGRSRGWTLEDR